MSTKSSAEDTNKQHRIILSMYYSNIIEPGEDEDNSILNIDLMELLLLMHGVFGALHFRLYIDPRKQMTNVDVIKDQEENYLSKVSTNDVLKQFNVLDVNYDKHFKKEEYKDIFDNQFEEGAFNRLFFYDTLFSYVNLTCTFYERDSFIYYLLFNCEKEGGKIFISYLKNRLVDLVNRVCDSKEYGDPQKLADCLINDYNSLNNLFLRKKHIIGKLKIHVYEIQEYIVKAENDAFKVGSAINDTNEWINDHYTDNTKSFVDFIFMRADTYRSLSVFLIKHIVRISKLVIKESYANSWSKSINKCRIKPTKTMKKADDELKRFEKEYRRGTINKEEWRIAYIKALNDTLQYVTN